MAILTLMQGSLAYGDDALLDKADFSIEEGERVCLLGRNGTGKSTLLKVFAGLTNIDDGRLIIKQGLKIARLMQDPPLDIHGTAYSMVAKEIPVVGEALAKLSLGDSDPNLASFIESHDGFTQDAKVRKILNKLEIDPNTPLEALSGGWRRKVALAAAFVQDPDLLLLDEPTNHLDIKTISDLEGWIKGFKGTIIFVSHDRTFTDNLATRIVELDRGKLYSYEGSFNKYLLDRDERLRKEELYRKEFDRVLAEEEAWIRRGVKARLARNEGRVRNLKALREERANRRDRQGRVILSSVKTERSGNIIFEASNICASFDGKKYIDDFSCTVMRGDRIGIVGANGTGKTTLIKILMGLIKPDSGKVKLGSNLKVEYFDQYHESLDLDKTVADNVAEGKQDVVINNRSLHVISYLRDYLFSARRVQAKVSVLSGGEKNRLMLAKIFARPCNVLIMDEPTNDLDLETLELLEEQVSNFDGTVIIISHDRRFIDKFATETWVFEGNGHIETIVGGFREVEFFYKAKEKALKEKEQEEKKALKAQNDNKAKKEKKNKLTFTQAYELKNLPDKIEEVEAKLSEVDAKMADPNLFKNEAKTKETLALREGIQKELDELYARFEYLLSLDE